MSEETIINGIDVSECAYYNKDNEPYCCEIWENECEAQNCYFKQLKHLQKENEELKEKITKFRWDNPYYVLYNNVVGQRDNLERENEELRQVTKNHPDIQEPYIYLYRQIKKQCHKLEEQIEEYKNRYCELYENADQLANKTYKYKQALEEIRNYCDEQNLKADYTACYITNRIDEVLK